MVRSPQLSGDRLGCGETVGNPGPKEEKKNEKKVRYQILLGNNLKLLNKVINIL